MKEKAREYYNEKMKSMKDAELRFFDRPEIDFSQVSNVHLTGVCGTAMGSLAGLFREAGYEVSGSDKGCYPPMSDFIKESGIQFQEGFDPSHIEGKDLVIIANMFDAHNIEAKYARENSFPQLSMTEAIRNFFIKDCCSLVVAGTHGKTTTTGLLAHVFTSAGFDPGFLIGGVMVNSGKSFHVGNGDYFIIEGDEYDTAYFDKSPKFLHYVPQAAIITSVEFDHADIYHDFTDYKKAFEFLAEEIPADGLLLLCGDNYAQNFAEYTEAPVLFYGLDEGNDVTARDVSVQEDGQHFTLVIKGEEVANDLVIPLFGKYNLQNTLAVCALAITEGISIELLREGLKTFLGMKRRQEIIHDGKAIIIDDFAHHPTAVRETLSGIRERFPKRRIVAVFEPRSVTSRKKIFESDYGTSFLSADCVFLSMPALKEVDNPDDFVDTKKIVDTIVSQGKIASSDLSAIEVLPKLASFIQEGDVVVIMSNGSFDGIHLKLATLLSV
ncbi:MAG: Mur ligase family protein [Candidatus Paceibacterota bacterium]|jgi:UDP-N-acetylmuramate: L-alanyl-gamma-D-glutamyl-meso-diaminopimelate ligase